MANNSDYEVITGLSLASGTVNSQLVTLVVDTDKTCYVVLPDGSILASTDGVISDDWLGAAGAVTLIVPKTSVDVGMSASEFIGSLLVTSATGEIDLSVCTGITSLSAPNATNLDCHGCTSLTSIYAPNATEFYCYGCTSLTSVSAPNATYIDCSGCTSLTSLSAPNATSIDASGCALTGAAIESLLLELYTTGKQNGTVDISGGTNADYATWSLQAKADAATLQTRGWTITYNEA